MPIDVIAFDEKGKPKIKEMIGESVKISDNIVMDFTEVYPLGNCLCCGSTEYVAVSGNAIMITCDMDDKGKKTVPCERNSVDECHGIHKCKKDVSYDHERERKTVEIVIETVETIFKIAKVVLLYSGHPHLRKVFSEYLTDRDYIVGNCMFGAIMFFAIEKRDWKPASDQTQKPSAFPDYGGDYYLT